MTASFCWQCNKKLTRNAAGELVFETYEVEPGRVVAVHKVCADSLKKPEPPYSNTKTKKAVKDYQRTEWRKRK